MNVPQLTLRSLQIARSAPCGPVYLMGAREVMEAEIDRPDFNKLAPAKKWKPINPMALDEEVCSLVRTFSLQLECR
jgi:acetolactate synthase-1/2/3 large subunit